LRVDRSELAAIDGNKLRTEEVQLLAQQSEGAADLAQGLKVVFAEVSHRLVVGPELLQQPHQFDTALRLLLKAATRTQAVEITIEGELQETTRGIAGAPCRSRHGTSEAACFEGEFVDKGIEEADGIVLGNIVVEALGERSTSWWFAPWIWPIEVQGSETERQLLFTVGNAIVHEPSEF
jgi:hypothetical protein